MCDLDFTKCISGLFIVSEYFFFVMFVYILFNVSLFFVYFQDQYDHVALHTQKGIDFCDKYTHFLNERCKIELDYAKQLK